jgi:mxaJ protein
MRNLLISILMLYIASIACNKASAEQNISGANAHESHRVLRIAADPNNLPFSNKRGQGFENKLAELITRELNSKLEYLWYSQRRGFFRETLDDKNCDLVMGAPSKFQLCLTTRPYYRSTYVTVTRKSDLGRINSLDDARLNDKTIGIQLLGDGNAVPPANYLATRGLGNNVRGFSLYADYDGDDPQARIINAVASGEIDVALAWGPLAGYYASRQTQPLEVSQIVSPPSFQIPFTFAISVGVQVGKERLRDEVDSVLAKKQTEIDAILREYNVPLLPIIAQEASALP